MRTLALLLLCFCRPAASSAAELIFGTAGQSSSMEKRETSARVAALGGNGSSMDEGSDSVLSNPATLALMKGTEFGAHHQSWLADINQEVLTAATVGPWGGAWGLAVGLVDYGVFNAVDQDGQPQGTVAAQDYSLTLAWAHSAGAGLSLGGSARFAQELLAGEGQTQGSVDLGLHWNGGHWQTGVVFADVASTLLGGNRGPSAVRGEISGDVLQQPGALRSFGGFSAEPGGLSRLQVGLETTPYKALTARAGYEARLGSTLLQGFNSATFGLGFTMGPAVVDYAFLPFGDLGAGHRLSLKWRLVSLSPKPPVEAALAPVPAPVPVAPPPLPTSVATPVAVPVVSPAVTDPSLQFKVTEDALDEARRAEDAGHFDRALAIHQELLARIQDNPVIWRSLGDLQYRAGHHDAAVQAYDQALAHGLVNKELQDWLVKYRSQP